ncbi:hypothetical protein JYK14_01365 [Siccirubricoccus sp. KC 17139]|uniref:Uncharacterized protein n=1 Tax=Siccirubricoccus soli TaxID=2899147 RepID=A0ABT1CYV4_9PROT|nr:hypothetical protein [Siccirubricoccus soli]MCO6414829.1 hypothetical protein [Siccirubricoccus soli]MCP2680959.1 hypothetical protein [Siccirubricoccus soli]
MPLLASLKMVSLKPSVAANDPASRVRAKLLNAIAEQVEWCNSQIEGKPFKATRKVQGVEQDRKFRPWAFKHSGTWYVSLKYGSSPIQINGGTAIESGAALSDVLNVLDVVKQSVEAGELDEALLKLAAQRGKSRKGVAASTPADAPEKPAQGRTAGKRS